MTRKRRRLVFLASAMLLLGGAVALVLNAFTGSLARDTDGVTIRFRVTDLKRSLDVVYRGVLPDLFREGQGVVAEGQLAEDGSFVASEVLAKHDETYMPPEVAEALKKQGVWREG